MGDKSASEGKSGERKMTKFLSKQRELEKLLRLRQVCKRGNQDLKGIAKLFSKLPLLMSKYEICNNLCYSNQFLFYQKENNKKAQICKMHLFDQAETWVDLEQSTIAKGSILHQLSENSCMISGGWQEMQSVKLVKNQKIEKTYSLSNHSYHTLCQKKDDIYLFTGYSQECAPFDLQSNCEVYNQKSGYFREIKNIPFPVESCGSGFIRNQIYIFGGGNGQHDITSIQQYDPKLNRWQIQDDQSNLKLPVPSNIRASYDLKKIFAFGNSRYAQLKKTLLFDEKNLINHGDGYKGQVTTNNPVLVNDYIFSVDSTVQVYDIRKGNWVQNWVEI